MSSKGWERLGRRIQTEPARLGYANAAGLARAADLSARTIEILEAGSHTGRPRDTTLSRIEVALGWRDGSCLAVVGGSQPHREPDFLLARLHRAWPDLTTQQRTMVVQAVEAYIRR